MRVVVAAAAPVEHKASFALHSPPPQSSGRSMDAIVASPCVFSESKGGKGKKRKERERKSRVNTYIYTHGQATARDAASSSATDAVRVQVYAAGLNYADVLMAQGKYQVSGGRSGEEKGERGRVFFKKKTSGRFRRG